MRSMVEGPERQRMAPPAASRQGGTPNDQGRRTHPSTIHFAVNGSPPHRFAAGRNIDHSAHSSPISR